LPVVTAPGPEPPRPLAPAPRATAPETETETVTALDASLDGLTVRQRRFVKRYAVTGNARLAVRESYNISSDASADSMAQQLRRKPKIRFALRGLLPTAHGADSEALRLIHAAYLAKFDSPDPTDRRLGLKALDLANKVAGTYTRARLEAHRHAAADEFAGWTAQELEAFATGRVVPPRFAGQFRATATAGEAEAEPIVPAPTAEAPPPRAGEPPPRRRPAPRRDDEEDDPPLAAAPGPRATSVVDQPAVDAFGERTYSALQSPPPGLGRGRDGEPVVGSVGPGLLGGGRPPPPERAERAHPLPVDAPVDAPVDPRLARMSLRDWKW
jgi:hypothetical protein